MLSDSGDRLGERIKDVDTIVRNNRGAVPKDFSTVFNGTFLSVCSKLEGVKSTIDKSCFKNISARCKQPNGQQDKQATVFPHLLNIVRGQVSYSISGNIQYSGAYHTISYC